MATQFFPTIVCLLSIALPVLSQTDATNILENVDRNLSSRNRIVESEMTIHGKRNSRTITARTWSEGNNKSFTEYLSPPREQGTKMLKLDNQLWIYSPASDRTIQISGHMLRQSLMGSDLSYEDMMDDRKLADIYEARLEGEELIGDRRTWLLTLTAKTSGVAYHSQKIWVDAERFVPLRQEMFAKSGQLLKRTTLSNVQKLEGRWFPMTIIYKDMLKDGEGTSFKIRSIRFDQEIPEYVFTKAALKK